MGDGVGDGVGVRWVGLAPSRWVMWVIICVNLGNNGCICNYTYRIGGVPGGRDPHDPPRLKTHDPRDDPQTAHTIAHAKTRRRRAATRWIDLDSRGHDPHDPHQYLPAHDPHDPRLTSMLGMRPGGRDPR